MLPCFVNSCDVSGDNHNNEYDCTIYNYTAAAGIHKIMCNGNFTQLQLMFYSCDVYYITYKFTTIASIPVLNCCRPLLYTYMCILYVT